MFFKDRKELKKEFLNRWKQIATKYIRWKNEKTIKIFGELVFSIIGLFLRTVVMRAFNKLLDIWF